MDEYANSKSIILLEGDIVLNGMDDVKFYRTTFDVILDLVWDEGAAKESIYVEISRIPNNVDFRSLTKLLCLKAEMGVDVRMLLGRGTLMYNSELKALKRSGVKIRRLRRTLDHSRNYALVVIDGRIAYYGENSFRRIEGPNVLGFKECSESHWSSRVGTIPREIIEHPNWTNSVK